MRSHIKCILTEYLPLISFLYPTLLFFPILTYSIHFLPTLLYFIWHDLFLLRYFSSILLSFTPHTSSYSLSLTLSVLISLSLSLSLSRFLHLSRTLPTILPYYIRCSDIDIVSGVALFDSRSQIYEMVDFANAVAAPDGGIEELVYNASVATINIAIFNNSVFNTYINSESRASLNRMGTPAWRKDAYDFCVYPCVGIAFINSYGSSYDRSINGDSYQIEHGSCNDSTTISDAAWYCCAIIYLCLSVCLSVCLSIYLSVCLSVCLSFYVSFCLSMYLSVCLSVYLCVPLSVCYINIYYVSVFISLFLSTCLSFRLRVCLSVSPSACLFACISV